jgi:hypothetical protein|tara:strand:- start:9663 stop:9956 length:294 start_codon:yes stop_codon:yes gene_type:complete
MKNKYEVGGEVMISGKWYEIDEVSSDNHCGLAPVRIRMNKLLHWARKEFIQGYSPPAPSEWITDEMMSLALNTGIPIAHSLNIMLDGKYGEAPHAEN